MGKEINENKLDYSNTLHYCNTDEKISNLAMHFESNLPKISMIKCHFCCTEK